MKLEKANAKIVAGIDTLNYSDTVKAIRAHGFKGTWIAIAKVTVLKSLLKGDISEADAKACVMTFGAPVASTATPPTDTLNVALKAAIQPELESMQTRWGTAIDNVLEAVDELASKVTTGGGKAEIPPTLLADVENLKSSFTTISNEVARRNSKLQELTDAVKSALAAGSTEVAKIIAPFVKVEVATAAASSDPTLVYMERYCSPGASLKPVLVKGGQGSGKTFGAREWGKKFDTYIEFGFNPETMPSDMFGFPTALESWVDGPIARAWRLAAAGQKVFVTLDEIYRAQGAARQSMLTPLSPRVIDGKSYYALNTGRPIVDPITGVPGTEEILAPRENLAIVATTNVGGRFDVNSGCPAEKERFAIVHVEVEEAKLRAIITSAVEAKKFHVNLVNQVIEFWKECKILAADNFIEICPSTRILTEGILYASSEKDVPTSLAFLGMNIWVAETLEGLPEQEQVKKVTLALKKHFTAAK
jgi:uncharacterized protein YegL